MKIKAIEQTNSRLGRVRLRMEDGSGRMVYPSVVADMGLYAGRDLSEEELSRLEQLEGLASARNRAVRIIAAGSVSKGDLRQRLIHKGEERANAEQAIQWLDELQLLDDEKTAAEIVQRGLRRGYGPARIRQMLYEKKIPKEYWASAMADLPPMDDAIDTFLSSRFRGESPDEKTIKRAVDAALRRGYSYADVRAGLRRYQSGLDDAWEEEL